MLTTIAFHKTLNRWINVLEEGQVMDHDAAWEYLNSRYFGNSPYTKFVTSEYSAEDLICYEVEF